MNQLIEERIEIIKGLKTNLIDKGISIEKRIMRLRIYGIFSYGGSNLMLILLFLISASALFHYGPFGFKWNKSMLLTFMTISISLYSHFSYIEFLLSKHLKKMYESDFIFDKELNSNLKELIDRMNDHRFKPYWIMIPAVIVMIATIIISLLSDEVMSPEIAFYWNKFPVAVFVIALLLLWNLNYTVISFRNNIEKVESYYIQAQMS